jgi:hypothetical protein
MPSLPQLFAFPLTLQPGHLLPPPLCLFCLCLSVLFQKDQYLLPAWFVLLELVVRPLQGASSDCFLLYQGIVSLVWTPGVPGTVL